MRTTDHAAIHAVQLQQAPDDVTTRAQLLPLLQRGSLSFWRGTALVLLASNLVTMNSLGRQPLPRFWYLPDARKAALIHLLDDHDTPNGTRATKSH